MQTTNHGTLHQTLKMDRMVTNVIKNKQTKTNTRATHHLVSRSLKEPMTPKYKNSVLNENHTQQDIQLTIFF